MNASLTLAWGLVAVFLGWRFNRSRLLFGTLVVLLADLLLRRYGGALLLSTLLYSDEIVSPLTAGIPKLGAATAGQLKVARQIVSAMGQTFQAGKIKDTHRKKVLALISKKARGQAMPSVRLRVTKPTRLVELLKQLEKSREVAKFAASRRR